MNSKLILYKIETLLSKSPSVLRIGVAVWPLRIISYILSPVFLICGVLSIMASVAFIDSIDSIKNDIYRDNLLRIVLAPYVHKLEVYAFWTFIGGIVMLIASVLFLIIAWLCRLVRNRNTFIGETTATLTSIKNDLAQTDKNA